MSNAGSILRAFYDAVLQRDMVRARTHLGEH